MDGGHTHGDRKEEHKHSRLRPQTDYSVWYVRFQRFQHCKVSPKLPVLPTTAPVPSSALKQPGRVWTGGTNPNPRGHRGPKNKIIYL